MSQAKFGTDGIRGVANIVLTPELAFQVGQAAGAYLVHNGMTRRVVIGRDTRRSGPMLGAAMAAGLCSAGVDVLSLGVMPTGGISFVARTGDYGFGVVISASHNPAPDNGIKLLASDGRKVTNEVERWIEQNLSDALSTRPTGGEVGELTQSREPVEAYMDWLESLVPERLEGMNVIVDGANGAAFELGPELFRRLGANVTVLGTKPDGLNINHGCGATKPEVLQEATQAAGADLGVAFDGDADRAIFSDHMGRLINGDRTMALWCAHWRQHGGLQPLVVVGTVMSNTGFEKYMDAEGIQFVRADVGDKYVAAQMREFGGKVGGEQSGHIIFSERGPTGDGLVTALEVARVLKREGKPAAEFFERFDSWPQLLVNVSVDRKDGWDTNETLQGVISASEAMLAGHGRVNVRASGTQPMLRVMAEADSYELRDSVADKIVQTMLAELGGSIYSRVDLTHALGD